MASFAWTPAVVVLIAACIAAVTDVWKFRVYNVLTIPLAISGLAYHALFADAGGFTIALLGMLFGFAVLLVPYSLGLMGAGDVKLLAGVGAWLGLVWTMHVFVVSSLVAGVYAVILIICRGKVRESWTTLKVIWFRFSVLGFNLCKEDMVEELVLKPDRRLRLIPFGAAIPIGIVGAILWRTWLP